MSHLKRIRTGQIALNTPLKALNWENNKLYFKAFCVIFFVGHPCLMHVNSNAIDPLGNDLGDI